MVRIDYSKNHFCNNCDLKVALDIWRCPQCKQKVRYKSHYKGTYYARHKEEIAQNRHRRDEPGYMTFKVKMRKLRVKRILEGLKPNIPVPDVQ
jgi:predicted amidophosphoribosyltransferase